MVQDKRHPVPLEQDIMRDGKCPRCNHKGSIIDFLEAAGEGRMLVIFKDLPKDVQTYFLSYFSLFRPKSGCAIQQPKAERLLQELVDLVALGYVQMSGQVDRRCPPRIWATAMEQMIEQAGRLKLPMKNHNYLKSIAWDLADKADAQQEKKQTTIQMNSRTRPRADADPALDPMEKARREWDERQKNGEVNVDLNGLSDIVKGMD